jgi:hypothetical protein
MPQSNVSDYLEVYYSYYPVKIHEQVVAMEDEGVEDWKKKSTTMSPEDDDHVDVILVYH